MPAEKYIKDNDFTDNLWGLWREGGFNAKDCGAAALTKAIQQYENTGLSLSNLNITDVKGIFEFLNIAEDKWAKEVGLNTGKYAIIKKTNHASLLKIFKALGTNKDNPDFESFDTKRAAFNRTKAKKIAEKIVAHPDFAAFVNNWAEADTICETRLKYGIKSDLLVKHDTGLGKILNDVFGHGFEIEIKAPDERKEAPAMGCFPLPNGDAQLVINPATKVLNTDALTVIVRLAHEHHHGDQNRDRMNNNTNWFLQSICKIKFNGKDDFDAYFGNLVELDAYHFCQCVGQELQTAVSNPNLREKLTRSPSSPVLNQTFFLNRNKANS